MTDPSRSFFRMLSLAVASILIAQITDGTQHTHEKHTDNGLAVCDVERGLLLVQQQIDLAKKIDDPVSSIKILIRVADTLWPLQQEAARTAFMRAYEMAEKHFKENGYESGKKNGLRSQLPDQRFVVLSAVASWDPAWARQLTERAVEATKRDTENTASPSHSLREAEDLRWLARSILPVDKQIAVRLFRSSLPLPCTAASTNFLFSVAETDQALADSLYQAALDRYANAPTNEILWLSAYPFAQDSVAGPEAQAVKFVVPNNFVANRQLQQLFLNVFFQRCVVNLKASPKPAGGAYDLPEPAQAYLALSDLENVIRDSQPEYLSRSLELKSMLGAALYSDVRVGVEGIIGKRANAKANTFDKYIEQSEHIVGDNRRDQLLATALLNPAESESTDRLIDLTRRISNSSLRQQVLDHLYFLRAQKATKAGLLDDARLLAEKVEPLDQRAYLSYEIAAEGLNRQENSQRARELLEAVVEIAGRAPNTNEKARALLGIVHLYSRFDRTRALEIMSDAVRTINKVAEPDVLSTTMQRRIQASTFAHYASYSVEGFGLENVFRSISSFDFERVLDLAGTLDNKVLRSTSLIAAAAICLDKEKSISR